MQVTSETEGENTPREATLDRLDRASEKLRTAAALIDEVAASRPPKGHEKEGEELAVLAEEARDVYVRVRAARDAIDARPLPAGS